MDKEKKKREREKGGGWWKRGLIVLGDSEPLLSIDCPSIFQSPLTLSLVLATLLLFVDGLWTTHRAESDEQVWYP
jgi:hypothetical protein